jgi:hypothetical protein
MVILMVILMIILNSNTVISFFFLSNNRIKSIMSLQLKKFNMNMIKDDQVVILIGKRNSGKTL